VLDYQLPNWNIPSDIFTYRHARYSIGDYGAAANAYRRGLELDPNNASMQAGLRNSEAQPADVVEDTTPPSAASAGGPGGLADTLRNLGGAGAGDMPGIASMMNNPGMMQMAQQMMANGGMERLMSNPTVANMVSCIESRRSLVA
jgi:small glutamine-rich tetratricopeptide repeat-containing protein alpha